MEKHCLGQCRSGRSRKKKKKRGWSERPAKAGGAQTGTRVGGGTLTAGWLGAHVEAEWRSTLWGKLGLALPSPKACVCLFDFYPDGHFH